MPAGNIKLRVHRPEHLRALLVGGDDYEQEFRSSVAERVKEFLAGPDVSEAFLERVRSAPAADRWRDGFGIVHLAENRLIGLCSFNGPPEKEGAVEISYAIAPSYVGRGYATEAVRLLVARAFADPRVRTVQAHTLREQSASTRILQKCGFKDCGELDDPVDGPIWRWELGRAAWSSQV
ncbi:MAG: GNAT family N-acetyltransferase [Spartobacteria bacterium]